MNTIININYKEGQNRKALAAEISEITGESKKYLGAPSMAYQVGGLTITRQGNIEVDGNAALEDLESLAEQLAQRGYFLELPKSTPEEKQVAEENKAESGTKPFSGLEVSFDKYFLDGPARSNLAELISGKETLIKHALGIEDISFEVEEEHVVFRWFKGKDLNEEESYAYTNFISKLVVLAKTLKRVNAKEDKEIVNEKYAFRCFLIRLGLKGSMFKNDRKILLRNLSGSAAFRDGKKKEAEKDAVSE